MATTDSAHRSALLVMDIMPLVTPAFGGDESMITHINTAIDGARAKGIPVLFGRVAFRPGYPEVSSNNQMFTGLKDMMDFTETNSDAGIHPDLSREETDVVFTKRRVSSFAGSDLDLLLHGFGVDTVVLAGVSTSGVVLSTVRAAADMDYRIVVLEDCCGDRDPDVHRTLMEKVFPAQATVLTADAWTSQL